MDVSEVVRRRLVNQWLTGAGGAAGGAAAVVARFGAMQAQEHALAKWSIGQRAPGLDDTAVQRALDDGSLLRTHALRPTWHVIAAADLRWIQALTGPRVHAVNGYYNRLHGLDDALADRAADVFTEVLRGGNACTRAELAAAIAQAGLPAAAGNRLAYVVMRAELDGLIASGPMRGRQHTYALVSERVPVSTALAGDAALAELTRRYFASRGPATVKDFAWWSSLTLAQVRRGIALLDDELESATVGDLRLWWSRTTVDSPESAPQAHVLQAYDEYVIAYKDSRTVANVAGVPLSLPNENTPIHAVIVDGQVAGLWRREVGRADITATVRLLWPLTDGQRREVEAAFARYATFTGVPVRVELR